MRRREVKTEVGPASRGHGHVGSSEIFRVDCDRRHCRGIQDDHRMIRVFSLCISAVAAAYVGGRPARAPLMVKALADRQTPVDVKPKFPPLTINAGTGAIESSSQYHWVRA